MPAAYHRLDYPRHAPKLMQGFLGFAASVRQGSLDPALHELVELRASQINGCAFCVDLHVKRARLHGERELRLHHVAVWRESSLFDASERAALEWCEVLTKLPPEGVPDDVYDRCLQILGEATLSELTFAIIAINGWNRAQIAFRAVPGARDAQLGLGESELA